MIYDKLTQLERYGHAFARAVDIIQACSAATPCGRIDIDGDNIFAKVEEYHTRQPDECLFESHVKYIDVQSCLIGAEGMHFLNIAACNIVRSEPENDYIEHMPKSSWYNSLVVHSGEAVIFFPQDAHRPQMCTYRGVEHIKKIVVKIQCRKPS